MNIIPRGSIKKWKVTLLQYWTLDSETTIVNFLKDRVLEFNKVILSGSSNIDEHIARELNISLQEAERLKKTYGMTPPNNLSKREHVITYGKVSNFIERLTRQIAKCFEFYLERCYGTPISKIFIIGGGSQLSGLNQYLFSNVQCPGLSRRTFESQRS